MHVAAADKTEQTTGTVHLFGPRILRSAKFKQFFKLVDKPQPASVPLAKRTLTYTPSDPSSAETSKHAVSSESSEVLSAQSGSDTNLTDEIHRLSINPQTSSPVSDDYQKSPDKSAKNGIALDPVSNSQSPALSIVHAGASSSSSSPSVIPVTRQSVSVQAVDSRSPSVNQSSHSLDVVTSCPSRSVSTVQSAWPLKYASIDSSTAPSFQPIDLPAAQVDQSLKYASDRSARTQFPQPFKSASAGQLLERVSSTASSVPSQSKTTGSFRSVSIYSPVSVTPSVQSQLWPTSLSRFSISSLPSLETPSILAPEPSDDPVPPFLSPVAASSWSASSLTSPSNSPPRASSVPFTKSIAASQIKDTHPKQAVSLQAAHVHSSAQTSPFPASRPSSVITTDSSTSTSFESLPPTSFIVTSAQVAMFQSTSSAQSSGSSEQVQASLSQQPAIVYRPPVPDNLAPRTFHGLPGESAETWYETYKLYVNARGLTLREELNLFPLFLRDRAADWYRSLATPPTTSALLEKAFRAQFAPTLLEKTFDAESVFSRAQQPGERVADYVVTMQRLAARLSSPETDNPTISADVLRSLVMRGLRPYIRRYVVQQNPKSMEEVLSSARAAEVSESVGSSESDKKIDALVAEVKNLGAQLVHQPAVSMVDRRSPTPERRRVTFGDEQVPQRQQPSRMGQRSVGRGSYRSTFRRRGTDRRDTEFAQQRGCQRCGRGTCSADNTCIVVQRNLSCYRCGRRGHLIATCRQGIRNENSQAAPRLMQGAQPPFESQ